VNLPNLKFHRAMLALRTPARPLVTVTWDSGISLRNDTVIPLS